MSFDIDKKLKNLIGIINSENKTYLQNLTNILKEKFKDEIDLIYDDLNKINCIYKKQKFDIVFMGENLYLDKNNIYKEFEERKIDIHTFSQKVIFIESYSHLESLIDDIKY